MTRQMRVGTRELKTRLGGYLRHVRAGHRLVITDRGEPIAELRPLEEAPTEAAALDRLQAIGTVTRRESRPLAAFQAIDAPDSRLSLAISEDRDDRI